MLLHSSGAAKRIKTETSASEDTVISGEGERFEWSIWAGMVPLRFHTKGDSSAPVCCLQKQIRLPIDCAPHQKTLMRLWSSSIMATVAHCHDECDCHAIENRIKRFLPVYSSVFLPPLPSCSRIPSLFSASSVSHLLSTLNHKLAQHTLTWASS